MIFFILKSLACIFILWVAREVWKGIRTYMQYLYYKMQGVAFNDKQGFNYFRDIGVFKNEIMGKEFGMFNAIAK